MKKLIVTAVLCLTAGLCAAQVSIPAGNGGKSILNTYFKSTFNKGDGSFEEMACVAPVISKECAIVEDECLGAGLHPDVMFEFVIKTDDAEQRFSAAPVNDNLFEKLGNGNSVVYYNRIVEMSGKRIALTPAKAKVAYYDFKTNDKKSIAAPANRKEPFLVQYIKGEPVLLALNSANAQRINLLDKETVGRIKTYCFDARFLYLRNGSFKVDAPAAIPHAATKTIEDTMDRTRSDMMIGK